MDFCSKYAFEPKLTASFAPFDEKLQSKGLSETQRQQARRAVAGYYRMVGTVKSPSTLTSDSLTKNTLVSQRLAEPNPALPNQTGLIPTIPEKPLISATDEPLKLTGSNWVAVYERLQAAIKVRNYSKKTWQAYRYWLLQFQTYTKSKDVGLLEMEDVKGFLSHFAMNKQVAASIRPYQSILS